MKKFIYIIIFCNLQFVICNCFSQTNKGDSNSNQIIDSLIKSLDLEKKDSSKLNTFNIISNKLMQIGNYDTALFYSNSALILANECLQTFNLKKAKAITYSTISAIYRFKSNYIVALKNDLLALTIQTQINDKKGLGATYNNIGLIKERQGNYPEALKNFFTALKFREQVNDK